jgi:drug/metabolite transporter (DMT)-like permease
MLVLCLVWGFQQIAIKAVATDIAPVLQLAIRFGIAGSVFGALSIRREGSALLTDGTLLPGCVVGIFFGVEFLLVAEALRFTTAAHSVVFLYTAPVFAALGLVFVPEERIKTAQWSGIIVAFIGIAVAFLGHAEGKQRLALLGDALALLSGLCWGLGAVILRRSALANASPLKTSFYQLLIAGVILACFAYFNDEGAARFTPIAMISLIFQTVVVAFMSYLTWFWLLTKYLASRLMLLSLMTPIFGVVFGHTLLGEPINRHFALGTSLVLGGIALVNGVEFIGRLRYWANRR